MSTEIKYCRKCGTKLSGESRFCPNCGFEFPVTPATREDTVSWPKYCRQCGKANAPEAKFCLYCGYSFGGSPSSSSRPQYKEIQPGHTNGQSAYVNTLPEDLSGKRKSSGRSGKKTLMRLTALVLILAVCFGGGAFLWSKFRNPEKLINRVQVFIPNPTAAEAMVNLQASVAIQYYIEARMYLEKLSQYDTENVDPEEFKKLADLTVTAFENADKMSDCLNRSVDKWMETDDVRQTPVITVLQEADGNSSFLDLFMYKVFAKEKSASEVRAQQIVDAFDKAKFGNKVKAVAELLGTDNKHAVVELKMALAALEGADAMEVAKQADNCVKVATTLKTAGTVAGLVIAAAPVATGAVATMATGELIVTGGGIVMGGINAGVEVTSTSAMLYYGTEDNVITKSAEKFQNSEFMQTANLLVNIGGVGYNIKNQIQNVNKLIDQADKIDDYNKLFTSLSTNNGKEASDLFGILSFGLSSLNPDDGILMTSIPTPTDNGMIFDIADTKIGTSSLQQEAMKKLLQESGYTASQSELAVATAVEVLESGKVPVSAPDDPAAPVPAAAIDRILEENKFIAPDNTEFNIDDFTDLVGIFMDTLAEYEVSGLLPGPSGNEQGDGSGSSADGNLPLWLNGYWIGYLETGQLFYNSYKFEVIDEDTIRMRKAIIDRDIKTGEIEIKVLEKYVFDCDYSVDPRTGTVNLHSTPTGLTEGLLSTEPMRIPVATDGNIIYGFTIWPADVTGDKLNEHVFTFTRHDELWPGD